MKIVETQDGYALFKEKDKVGQCTVQPTEQGAHIAAFCIRPEWQLHGYGSYLLKEVLRKYGGYDRERASVVTAPLPSDDGAALFMAKFDFAREGELAVRRRKPDLTAVQLVHDWLQANLHSPLFCIDATCGNGGDTLFLCGLAENVLAMDVQQQAIDSTRARLQAAGVAPDRYTLVRDDHAHLLRYAEEESADAVLFNFGWLPGAEHAVFSTAQSSIPALEASLRVLKRGGILSAVLYSGKGIGDGEKHAVLQWLRALPIRKYTVLICEFGNWDKTAPLPCFVMKK